MATSPPREEVIGIDLTPRDQQVLAAMVAVPGARVFDVGGASGHYCRVIKRYRPEATCTMLETPEMVKAQRSTQWLTFTDSSAGLGRFDVILMSGFLQYVADPWRTFDELASHGDFVLINRHRRTAATG